MDPNLLQNPPQSWTFVEGNHGTCNQTVRVEPPAIQATGNHSGTQIVNSGHVNGNYQSLGQGVAPVASGAGARKSLNENATAKEAEASGGGDGPDPRKRAAPMEININVNSGLSGHGSPNRYTLAGSNHGDSGESERDEEDPEPSSSESEESSSSEDGEDDSEDSSAEDDDS